MTKKIQRGLILLADISGYDAYITKVELDHAKGVVKELLELIVEGLTPTLTLASLEGDAVLAFADEKKIPGSKLLIGLIKATYVEFRDRVASIQRNNSCDCHACADAPSLDLKFFVHYGEYSIQSVNGGSLELGGLDVKLVRERLLKDQVNNTNGSEAFVLYTEQFLDRMGLVSDGMKRNRRSYPYLGEIKTARQNLQGTYDEMQKARLTSISEGEASFSVTHEFNAPPSIVWDWLNDPKKRSLWMKWRTWNESKRPWGKNGIGAENHCAHGFGTLIETILEWNPDENFTVQSRQDSIDFLMIQTFCLESFSGGSRTRLHVHTDLKDLGLFKLFQPLLHKVLQRLWKQDYEVLENLLTEEALQLKEHTIHL